MFNSPNVSHIFLYSFSSLLNLHITTEFKLEKYKKSLIFVINTSQSMIFLIDFLSINDIIFNICNIILFNNYEYKEKYADNYLASISVLYACKYI